MIYVITHKVFDDSNLEGDHYRILHVGTNDNCKDSYLRDDTGDNISEKNPNYCELTGLYWIWKNAQEADDEIDGLVHYRRHFTTDLEAFLYDYFGKKPSILPYSVIEKDLKKYDIILPRKRKTFRKVSETYAYFHNDEDLAILERAIDKAALKYIADYRKVMDGHEYYFANMMICRHELLKQYAEWLFDVLFEVEKYIDLDKYEDDYQRRVFGFMSERLLQVWVAHKKLKVKEYSVFNTEERGETVLRKNAERVQRIFRKHEK